MRILLITEYLPASDQVEITGGVEAYAHYVGGHLRDDHDVTILSRPTDGSVWDAASVASLPGRLLFLLRALVRGLRTPADVVIGTTYVVHPIAWLVGKLRRRPVVFWYPDVLLGTWRAGGFGRVAGVIGELAERVILRLPVDRYLAISQSTADKLAAHGVDPARITVIPCGFDQATVDAVTPEPGGEDRITVVTRLVPYKRVDLAVRALPGLPELHLVVIGQGPEHDRLTALAAELGVADRVELRGFVARHTDVLATIAGSRAFVSASEVEGFGIVVAEAMALGTPYAVSDIPAHREVTDGGRGGALFPPGERGGPGRSDPGGGRSGRPGGPGGRRRRGGRALPVGRDRGHHGPRAGARRRRQAELTAMDIAPLRELRRLAGSARFHLSERGVRGVADEVVDVTRSYVTYPLARRSRAGRTLTFGGRQLPEVLHHYNRAWRNERTVELTLAQDFLATTTPGRTLEIGNVLSHYLPVDHAVLDKYEASPGVMNVDIVDFEPEVPYDRVVTISTLEHVGWDERPREPEKVLRAYHRIRELVRDGGSILLTCPLGQNPHLDAHLHAGEIDFPVQRFLRRVSDDNRWEECAGTDVVGAQYGSPYRNANAVFVGVVPGEDCWGV